MCTEPLVAFVYGDTPPDFAAIAACGFDIVCVDSGAPWFNPCMLANARDNGLVAFAFRMGYTAGA